VRSGNSPEDLGLARPQAGLIERCFEFLLARESNRSILRRFDLAVIGRYFPEYETATREELTQRSAWESSNALLRSSTDNATPEIPDTKFVRTRYALKSVYRAGARVGQHG